MLTGNESTLALAINNATETAVTANGGIPGAAISPLANAIANAIIPFLVSNCLATGTALGYTDSTTNEETSLTTSLDTNLSTTIAANNGVTGAQGAVALAKAIAQSLVPFLTANVIVPQASGIYTGVITYTTSVAIAATAYQDALATSLSALGATGLGTASLAQGIAQGLIPFLQTYTTVSASGTLT
ncbi:MAG: hypothetical protein KGL95_09660 [Patescibacteria group bacterium]|nr:hypothetical protein [Patescibacteria group bacterium]